MITRHICRAPLWPSSNHGRASESLEASARSPSVRSRLDPGTTRQSPEPHDGQLARDEPGSFASARHGERWEPVSTIAGGRYSTLAVLGHRPRVLPANRRHQSVGEKPPSFLVLRRGLAVGKPSVPEPKDRAVAVRLERELHRRRPGRGALVPLPSPREDHASRGLDLDELAAGHGVRVHPDPVHAAGARVEFGPHALPTDVAIRVGEEPEDLALLRWLKARVRWHPSDSGVVRSQGPVRRRRQRGGK